MIKSRPLFVSLDVSASKSVNENTFDAPLFCFDIQSKFRNNIMPSWTPYRDLISIEKGHRHRVDQVLFLYLSSYYNPFSVPPWYSPFPILIMIRWELTSASQPPILSPIFCNIDHWEWSCIISKTEINTHCFMFSKLDIASIINLNGEALVCEKKLTP